MNNKYLDNRLCSMFDVKLAQLHELPINELEQLRADLLFRLAHIK